MRRQNAKSGKFKHHSNVNPDPQTLSEMLDSDDPNLAVKFPDGTLRTPAEAMAFIRKLGDDVFETMDNAVAAGKLNINDDEALRLFLDDLLGPVLGTPPSMELEPERAAMFTEMSRGLLAKYRVRKLITGLRGNVIRPHQA